MAGQLSAGDRLRRLRLVGLGVLALALVAVASLAAILARAAGAPQARYVVRPELSVHGVTAGSVVRLSGVVIGRVAKVGLWGDPSTGRVRPEVVLALDPARSPELLRLRAGADDGLRVRFVPVNAASGLLEVDLVWAPGTPRLSATADSDELPWQPSEQQLAFNRLMPMVRKLASEELAPRVERLLGALGSAEARVAQGPEVVASLARRAAGLREAVVRLDGVAGAGSVATLQGRLGELREALAALESSLDALDRDLAACSGSAAESLRDFSKACRASAARLRRQVPEDDPR